jgi:hypothetical protein
VAPECRAARPRTPAWERNVTTGVRRSRRGRYVLIWFTKLPPAGAGRFQVQIFNITVRGTVSSRLAGQAQPAPTQERRT